MTSGVRGRLRRLLGEPEVATDLLQIVKCVVAATAAWWISGSLLHSTVPFLAPWTALLTVHATIYRSLSRGVQTTVASAVGTGLSFVIGAYLGVSPWTFGLALMVGLVGSRLSWLRDEGIAIATTAIFILGSGFSSQTPVLADRLVDVGLGVGVGIVVNLLLIPPLRNEQAARYIDHMNRRIGDILIEMAEELSTSWSTDRIDAWLDETIASDDELNSAWQTVRFARESARMNPRQRVSARTLSAQRSSRRSEGRPAPYEDILSRLGEGIAHIRHLVRTLQAATRAESPWGDQFRSVWVDILADTGHAIQDPDAEVEPLYDRITALVDRFPAGSGQRDREWPLYGSLITSLRHIVIIVDDVASARRARERSA